MEATLIEVIDRAAAIYQDKIAFTDPDVAFSFGEVRIGAEKIAAEICNLGFFHRPVALFMERSAKIPVAMAGVLKSGNFYTVLDTDSPPHRLAGIMETLAAELIVCTAATEGNCRRLFPLCTILTFERICQANPSVFAYKSAREVACDDIAFVIFTSGSTGRPKGTIITHRNVIAYINWFTDCFKITNATNFGSQTPFFFSMSVTDLYGAWTTGAAYHIIPKTYFSFPARLVAYLNEKHIDTIYWVPSALDIVAKFDLFTFARPEYLKNVLFAGEVMPAKILNYWRRFLPQAVFANLFGPTETTDICCYYVVDRSFGNKERLPIGYACKGAELLVIDENGSEITGAGEIGELYVGGSFVAAGYYNDPERTHAVFCQNPLKKEPEIVYRTGDLVFFNEFRQLEYVGRKDSQIKYMGYRIEPGEIETVLGGFKGIERCLCLFDSEREELVLFYEGSEESQEPLRAFANENLLAYMVPQRIVRIEAFPMSANGKIDRLVLRQKYLS